MSRSKASRARARDAKHVRLYAYVLKSEAWRSLSCPARCMLIELQALYSGTNNGELFMSVRTAAKALRTGKRQAMAAFAELEDRGFIRATRRGARTRRDESRIATCWRLTEFDDDLSGRSPTKEFMTWQAPAVPTVPKRVERARKASAASHRKFSTVPRKDTHRTPQGYGTPSPTPENAPDRTPQGYAQAAFEVPTVPHKDTQLINQVGAPEKTEPKGRAALARHLQSASPKRGRTYGGKPLLRLRVLDHMRSNRTGWPWTRGAIADELAVCKVRAGQALKELCELGYVERIHHGRYSLTDRERAG